MSFVVKDTSGDRPVEGARSLDDLSKQYLAGLTTPVTNDPGFQEPVDATDDNTKARAKLIYRDIPLVTIQNTWSIQQARGALYSHLMGQFYASGQLCDSILGDDRVSATLNSRASALFGRENRFLAADSSDAAKECLIAWQGWWPRLSGTSGIRELQDYGTMMGFAHGQLMWDTSQPNLDYGPYIQPWHPTYEWFDWYLRKYMAVGQDGSVPIVGGNGKWVEYCPWGPYRGWIRGALRPVVEPWMLRHFGFRDMARFSEAHGNPTRVGFVPIQGDPVERGNFEKALQNLGSDAAMIVPRGVDINDGMGYDYKLVEAQSTAWEVHPGIIDRCDMAIVLAILMTNLTTEIDGGSHAAAKVSMDIRDQGSNLDNQTWKNVIYNQIARPFAFLNFGDANLAPWTWWDVTPIREYEANSAQFQKFGTAIEVLRRGGIQFKDASAVRRFATEKFGLHDMPEFDIVEPVSSGMGGSK